jgi:hypothetical protein
MGFWRTPLLRLLAVNLGIGVTLAVLLVGGLLLLNPGGLRHLIFTERSPLVAIFAKVENSRVFATYEAALAMAQRANKARRVKAIHAKIANTRKDFLHKETTKIADAFGLICVGNVSGR